MERRNAGKVDKSERFTRGRGVDTMRNGERNREGMGKKKEMRIKVRKKGKYVITNNHRAKHCYPLQGVAKWLQLHASCS